jgi:galactokinase
MDQTACASGGAVFIDFGDPLDPRVNRINFDLSAPGYALCVVDTKGSHADLTPDYAAIPSEMKAVAAWFGKTVLREVDPQDLLTRAAEIRKTAGDRALLRALHFFAENRRVDAMRAALEAADKPGGPHLGAIYDFFALAEESGNSSWELLQNVYPPHNPREQGPALALALTREFFQDHGARKGVCRVHGGGFAGTIQAYIPREILEDYRIWMESFFGPGSVTALRIRSLGAAELEF